MTIGIVSFDIHTNLVKLRVAQRERLVVETQVSHWQGVVNRYKNYRDGYYQLAVLEYRLGNNQAAYDYSQKTLEMDPGFKEAKQLLEEISGS